MTAPALGSGPTHPSPTHPRPSSPGQPDPPPRVCSFRWVGAPNRAPKNDSPDHACALPPGHQPRGGDHVCVCGASHPEAAPRWAAA